MISSGRFKATAAVLIALAGTSGCTRQQIADAIKASTEQVSPVDAPTVDAPSPHVAATVDCHDFTFEVNGYPATAMIYINIGSNPPWGFSGGNGHLQIPEYDSTHVFDAIIDVDQGAGTERVYSQTVDCT